MRSLVDDLRRCSCRVGSGAGSVLFWAIVYFRVRAGFNVIVGRDHRWVPWRQGRREAAYELYGVYAWRQGACRWRPVHRNREGRIPGRWVGYRMGHMLLVWRDKDEARVRSRHHGTAASPLRVITGPDVGDSESIQPVRERWVSSDNSDWPMAHIAYHWRGSLLRCPGA